MFKLERNSFNNNGNVIYKDENDNKIIIVPTKNGQNLTVKIKLKDSNIQVLPLEYYAPYIDIEGATFKITANRPITNALEIKEIFKDAVSIIEKWVLIEQNLYQLFNYVPKDIDDEELEKITYEILNELQGFEETNSFALLYKNLLSKKGVLINV